MSHGTALVRVPWDSAVGQPGRLGQPGRSGQPGHDGTVGTLGTVSRWAVSKGELEGRYLLKTLCVCSPRFPSPNISEPLKIAPLPVGTGYRHRGRGQVNQALRHGCNRNCNRMAVFCGSDGRSALGAPATSTAMPSAYWQDRAERRKAGRKST